MAHTHTHTHTTGIRVTELALLKVADVLYPSGAIKSEVYRRADITKGCPTMARLTLTDFDEWLDGAVQTDVEDVYALHEAGLKECSVSATIPTGSAKNSESLAEAHESDLLKLIHGSPTVPEDAQLKRLLKDVERLNFWQAHDWYVGARTLDGEWRF